VIVLGETGKNFAAGMSGGIALVADENPRVSRHALCNRQGPSIWKKNFPKTT